MYLCINTALRPYHVALVDPSAGRVFVETLMAQQESETILVCIDRLFEQAAVRPDSVSGVFALTGPGGFTSLRIGLSIANAFAHELKIPIRGLRTDQWGAFRTDQDWFYYLQSMNQDEIYAIGKGIHDGIFEDKPIFKFQHFLFAMDYGCPWVGSLTELHQQELPPKFKMVTSLRSIEDTWLLACREQNWGKTFPFLEPYYAKEPTITRAKMNAG